MSGVAAIAFAAAPALAQQQPGEPLAPAPAQDPLAPAPADVQAAPEITPRTYEEVFGESLAGWEATEAEELLGKTVVDDTGEKLGDIDSFALAGDRIVAILGTGGFLGLGEHMVAIPVEQLTVTPDEIILAGVTQEEIMGLPEWDENPDEANQMGDAAPMAPATEPVATADAPLATADPAPVTPAENMATATPDAGNAVDNTTADVAAVDVQTAEPMSVAAEGETAVAQAPATEVAPAEIETTTPDVAANDNVGWSEEMDTIFADIADRQFAELIGMDVAGADGEVVGEVDNFVLAGDNVAAIVGVGGFLGMGEHNVALSLDEMTFDGEKLVLSSITGEQLRDMPAFDETGTAYLPQEGTLRSTYDAR
jgi:sporulation protein YlmC with PRC-barrel domain